MGTGNVSYYQIPGLYVTDYDEVSRARVAEVLDIIDALGLDFNLGNTIKYIIRHGRKPGELKSKDLQKAWDYLDRAVRVQKLAEAKEEIYAAEDIEEDEEQKPETD